MAPLDGFSLFRFIKSSPNLLRSLQPISNAYANAAGHRKVGLKYDDLIIEEDGKVQKVSTPAVVVPCAVAAAATAP
jgi:ubiquinol-cytochrome c reductase subunit 7